MLYMGAGTWYCQSRELVSACVTEGETDSIHLAPERVNDDTNSLIARSCTVRIEDVQLDCHGNLAFITGKAPAIEGNMRGLHGQRLFFVGLVIGFAVGLTVGLVGRSRAG